MTVRVVRLGTPRVPGEGVRIGTVRRPPRGVPKARYATDDWYDVWMPLLAPGPDTVKLALSAQSAAERRKFDRQYRREMSQPDASRLIDLLAALSHDANFSVGCYCEDESRCHRRVLRELLTERSAKLV
jgi:uncharacterized protein YeaO (DUF488 family)